MWQYYSPTFFQLLGADYLSQCSSQFQLRWPFLYVVVGLTCIAVQWAMVLCGGCSAPSTWLCFIWGAGKAGQWHWAAKTAEEQHPSQQMTLRWVWNMFYESGLSWDHYISAPNIWFCCECLTYCVLFPNLLQILLGMTCDRREQIEEAQYFKDTRVNRFSGSSG